MTRGTAGTSQRRPGGQHRRGSPRADAQDHPERKRVPRRRIDCPPGLRVAAVALAAVTLAAGLLFLGYLRVSWTVAATSDGAAQALQARDMLAGNWLLHGWTLSDVSFYTTELPEYVLVELVRPFGASVIHVAAAVTYTLLVLAACWLARGRARGTEGLVAACSRPGSCWRRSSGTGRSCCCSRRITSGRRCRCCSAGCCSTCLPGGRPSDGHRYSALVGACRPVPAARLGPVRRPGRARDGGPAAGLGVRGDPDAHGSECASRDEAGAPPWPGTGARGRRSRRSWHRSSTLWRGQRSVIFAPDGPPGQNRSARPWAVWRKGRAVAGVPVRGHARPGRDRLGRGGVGGGTGAGRRRGVRRPSAAVYARTAAAAVDACLADRVGHPRGVRRELPRRHRVGRAHVRRPAPGRARARRRRRRRGARPVLAPGSPATSRRRGPRGGRRDRPVPGCAASRSCGPTWWTRCSRWPSWPTWRATCSASSRGR